MVPESPSECIQNRPGSFRVLFLDAQRSIEPGLEVLPALARLLERLGERTLLPAAALVVERVPSPLEDGVIYVSIAFGTVIHRCCCGCGDKVVTPLAPVDWAVTYDGQSISLYPSIGRWDAPCRSHYWIRDNSVMWAEDWSQSRIDANRAHDRRGRRHRCT